MQQVSNATSAEVTQQACCSYSELGAHKQANPHHTATDHAHMCTASNQRALPAGRTGLVHSLSTGRQCVGVHAAWHPAGPSSHLPGESRWGSSHRQQQTRRAGHCQQGAFFCAASALLACPLPHPPDTAHTVLLLSNCRCCLQRALCMWSATSGSRCLRRSQSLRTAARWLPAGLHKMQQ